LTQLSVVLQKHPNLRELDLEDGTMPQIETSSAAAVPIALPHLTDLKLCGTGVCILGFLNLIGMSSPLHNVELVFKYPNYLNAPKHADVVKKILAVYYEREGLDHSRTADHFTVSSGSRGYGPLVFLSQSRSISAPTPQSTLKLQFDGTTELLDLFPLFPLSDTQEFTIEGLNLPPAGTAQYFEGLRKFRTCGFPS
jgi:hypothetical protein